MLSRSEVEEVKTKLRVLRDTDLLELDPRRTGELELTGEVSLHDGNPNVGS
jgi:hypothetical protein